MKQTGAKQGDPTMQMKDNLPDGSVLVYDLVTGNQIAKGGVKFYFSQLQSLNADAASENVENGTEED